MWKWDKLTKLIISELIIESSFTVLVEYVIHTIS